MKQTTHWAGPWACWRHGLFAKTGLIVGKAYGRLLRHNGPEHVLVVASTQSGKSTSFVIPNLLTWHQSVIVHDPKEELSPLTAGWRGTFSRVVTLRPASTASDRHNPLAAIRIGTDQEVRDVQLISEALTDPTGHGADRQSASAQHFTEMAREALGGLLLWGLCTQRARSLAAVNQLLVTMPFRELVKRMRAYPHPAIQRAAAVIGQTDGRDESSGIFSTLTRALQPYTDPVLARMTDRSDFRMTDLREASRPMTLYLSIPFGDQERLRGWTRLVLRQMLDYAVSTQQGWTWKLLGMIDEVPGLRRITLLTEGLNYYAGFGVRLALITPSLQELMQTYGDRHNFLEGCQVQIVYGMHDGRVAKMFSDRVGNTMVTKRRTMGGRTMTERVPEPLLSPTALLGLPKGKQLVIVGSEKVIASKPFYYHNPLWVTRSQVC